MLKMQAASSRASRLPSSTVHLPVGLARRLRLPATRAIQKQSESSDESVQGLRQAPDLTAPATESAPSVKVDAAGPGMPYSVITGIASLGVLETAYLTVTKLSGGTPACPVAGCDTVLSSSYAEVFGIPLPVFGFLAYTSMAALALAARQQPQQSHATLNTALTVGASLMAGVSGMLVYILATEFAATPCIWCYGSALLSFSLLATVIIGAPSRKLANAAAPGAGALTVALVALYLNLGAPDASSAGGEDFTLPYNAPVVTTQSPPEAVGLARRLKAAGAQMYGAFWCSHCFDQKQAFGQEAVADFPYVECYPNGWQRGVKLDSACEAAGVKAFPTWVINGQLVEGEQTLEQLAARLDAAAAPAPALEAALD